MDPEEFIAAVRLAGLEFAIEGHPGWSTLGSKMVRLKFLTTIRSSSLLRQFQSLPTGYAWGSYEGSVGTNRVIFFIVHNVSGAYSNDFASATFSLQSGKFVRI